MIKKETNKMNLTFILVLFQIFLLVNLTSANSYLLHQYDSEIDRANVVYFNESKIKKIIDFGVDLLIGFLTIKQIGTVSALEWNCCPKTTSGAICQDISDLDTTSCAVSPIPTKCDQFVGCKVGCCIDESEGLCTTQAPKGECEESGGKWEDEKSCLIQDCQKGCCVLGNSVAFATIQRCERLSFIQGFEFDFRNLDTELECILLKASTEESACILPEGTCKTISEVECLGMQGIFSKDYLCSHPDLNTSCVKQSSINCVDGEDEIYWFDSCGNKENIYSSDKTTSWNEGKVLSKSESCGSDSSNANSGICGNCNYFLGSQCSESSDKTVKEGDFICKSMGCVDESGNERKNGESWCVYDSYIGDGKDTVGSRHWKRMCIDGEIKVEPCADYRGQICVQASTEGANKFTTAACTINDALKCIMDYNSLDDMQEKCNKNKDCMIKRINIDKGFRFDVCVGKYPKGFDFTNPKNAKSSEMLCSMASQSCTIVYEKKFFGGWKCIDNCNCKEQEFAKQMNDLCISLGDCGSHINYIGDGTDNIKVVESPAVKWQDYKQYLKKVKGQYAEPRGSLGGIESLELEDGGVIKELGTISGSLGTVIGAAAWAFGSSGSIGSGLTYAIRGNLLGSGVVSPTVAAFGSALSGLALGVMIGSYLAQELGITGDAALVMTVAGGVAGAFVGYMYIKGMSAFGVWGVIIAVVVMIIVWLSGWGKIRTEEAIFTCMPWQPPLGGNNCDKCNDNPLKPCSHYRCSSLGQACGLLNVNTENSVCAAVNTNDGVPPKILTKSIDEFYKFVGEQTDRVEIRTNAGECMQEFTPVLFSLGTDEYAQCKFDFEGQNNYEDMGEYFIEGNIFALEHTAAFMMPSIDSFQVYNITGDLKQMFGDINMYIRCQDNYGNFNQKEYVVNFCIKTGPDKTPARITSSNPLEGAFLQYGLDEIPVTIYLNEPANCKYDVVENKGYEEMENLMDCKTDLRDAEIYGWPCSWNFTNVNSKENNFYIKCKDQPWLPDENTSRNINFEDFVYKLHVSESPLKIDFVSPSEDIMTGFEPVSIDLVVGTSGGVNYGKSACSFGLPESVDMIQFFNTFSNNHKQVLNLMSGAYNISVKCEDETGNIDSLNTTFEIKIDSASPMIVRAYNKGYNLELITDELAECYYDTAHCNFNIFNGTSMTTAFSIEHTAEWIGGQVYYVKCADIWGNYEDGCSMTVSVED